MTAPEPKAPELRKADPKALVHSAWTNRDGLVPCCLGEPRTIGELTLDRDAVTCKGTDEK